TPFAGTAPARRCSGSASNPSRYVRRVWTPPGRRRRRGAKPSWPRLATDRPAGSASANGIVESERRDLARPQLDRVLEAHEGTPDEVDGPARGRRPVVFDAPPPPHPRRA